ncbi:MAG: HWE histidine kinase domain-containing protein [Hyphomonadaceae bacterium]|nr:HWE histidine kinase domain-containing protein [Hyphomonadaceae bacterium]
MNASPPSRKGYRRVPVTTLIIVLILAVAAPSLAFSGLLLLQSDNVTRATMQNRAEQGVDGISDTLDRELRGMSTNLALLASSGWVEEQDYRRLHVRATEALKGTDTFLIAVDAGNKQILNTRVPWGTPLGAPVDKESIDRAMATGQPALSNMFYGAVARTQVFNVVMPLISGKFRVKALILTRDTAKLPEIFKERLPPPGWTYAILDGSGQRVAGVEPVGAEAGFLDKLCTPGTESLQEIKVDEIRFSARAEKLEPWGWRACVWTSSDQIEASISQRWRSFTILTLVVVSVTILMGAALGRTLAAAIRRAAAVSRALDSGGEVKTIRSRVREVDDVLGNLTRAARRKQAHEEEQKILLKETAHRAKNQIAIASALARLSAKSAQTVDQLRDDIVARLSALGRSIDMMAATPSGAVSLQELAKAQLEPFAADHPGRLDISGGDVRVAPATAQSLGLVLHEMATNAAKYGSWSTPDGRVNLDWAETNEGVTVVWSERGGPQPSPSSQAGFGSSLIEMMIEKTLGGSVHRDYRDTGLVATFKLPARPVTV